MRAKKAPAIYFGICKGNVNVNQSYLVPVDKSVKALLGEMMAETAVKLGIGPKSNRLPLYEPAQLYDAQSALELPLDDAMAGPLRLLYHHFTNIPTDAAVLDDPKMISTYFGAVYDQHNNLILGMRRAAQFKSIVASRSRIIQMIDNTLKATDDTVFKLDHDFDLLITKTKVYILRPNAFEHLVRIEDLVKHAAANLVKQLETKLTFVNFSAISAYATKYARGARVVASLRQRTDLDQTSLDRLQRECLRTDVKFTINDGKLSPTIGHELAFLNVLDRRRYSLSLIDGKDELYEAASRATVSPGPDPEVTAGAGKSGTAGSSST